MQTTPRTWNRTLWSVMAGPSSLGNGDRDLRPTDSPSLMTGQRGRLLDAGPGKVVPQGWAVVEPRRGDVRRGRSSGLGRPRGIEPKRRSPGGVGSSIRA